MEKHLVASFYLLLHKLGNRLPEHRGTSASAITGHDIPSLHGGRDRLQDVVVGVPGSSTGRLTSFDPTPGSEFAW